MADGTVTIDITADSDKAKKELSSVEKQSNHLADTASAVSGKMSKAFAAVGAAIAAAGIVDKVKDITQQAVDAASTYEQQTGGITQLFGNEGKSLQEFADSYGLAVEDAQGYYERNERANQKMIDNANRAYKTAGVSANDYLQTVTSFSSSLIKSLGGDTEAAADKADLAMVDMSDNANIFGSNIEDIQNAYQGFAKQNYTMLDNLKLGYGGTQSEMARLINDSGVLNGQMEVTAENVNEIPFSTIVDAIHEIQVQQGIAGDTAREASETFAGSYASMQAAADNFVTALGSEDMDLTASFGALLDSVGTFAANAIPMLQRIGDSALEIAPKIRDELPGRVAEIAGPLGEAIGTIAQGAIAILISAAPSLVDGGIRFFLGLTSSITETMPQITEALLEALPQISESLITAAPELVEAGIELFTALVTAVGEVLPEIVRAVTEGIPQIVSALGEHKEELAEGGKELFTALVDSLTSIGGSLNDAVDGVMGPVVGFVEGKYQDLKTAADGFFQGLPDALSDKAAGIAESVQTTVGNIGTAISERAGDLKTSAETFFQGLPDAISEKVETTKTDLGSKVGEMVDGVSSRAADMQSSAASFFGQISDSASSKAQEASSGLEADLLTMVSAVSGKASDMLGSGDDLFQKLVDAASSKGEETRQKIDELPGTLSGIISGAVGTLQGAAETMFGGLKSGAESKVDELTGWVSGIPQKIKDALGDVGSLLWGAGSSIMGSLADGLKSAWSDVTGFVGGIGTWIQKNKGPLPYDRKLLVKNGMAIMQGLSAGLQQGFERYVGDYMPDVTAGLSTIGAGVGGRYGSSATYKTYRIGEINISAADAIEAGSVEGIIDEALRRMPAWEAV